MKQLNYDFRDLYRSPRIGLSFQRIWTNGLGLFAAFLVYFFFSYLSLWISGYAMGPAWYLFGLLPCAFAVPATWLGMAVYIAGLFFSMAVILLTNTAMARLTYMVLRNEVFYTWTQAFRFAFRKWISVGGAFLTFLFLIGSLAIAAIVIGFIGRIPVIGELLTVLFTIPYIFAAFLLIFIIIAFFAGIFFIPAILATMDEDAIGGVFQSFSITFNQPWRLLLYSLQAVILEIVSMLVFAFFLKLSYLVFVTLFSWGMGEKMAEISVVAERAVHNSLPALYDWLHILFGKAADWVYLSKIPPIPAEPSIFVYLAGIIFAFFLLILGGAALAYGEAVGNSGMTISYLIIYRRHNRDELLKREDEELIEATGEGTEADLPPVENSETINPIQQEPPKKE
ncbi:MAG: hypothetical protein WAN36_02545 [Calditrichia bacterium]